MGGGNGMIAHVDTGEIGAVLAELQFNAQLAGSGSIMSVVAEMLRTGVGDVFEAEGPGWDDLAESTKMQPRPKAKKGDKRRKSSEIRSRRGDQPYKILQDSGLMLGSIGIGYEPKYAEAFGGAAYTIFHVRGGDNLPVRDPFDLGPFWEDILDDAADLIGDEVVR